MANQPKKTQKQFAKLTNLIDDKMSVDVLYPKSTEEVPCTRERCMGSLMGQASRRPPGVLRSKEELIVQAKDFIDQYYQSMKKLNSPAHGKRMEEVMSAIDSEGTYDLTTSELTFGAKTAWRNAPRCIYRIQWSKLQVFDARHVTTAKGMFEAICNHIKYGTNNGNMRASITVFPKRSDPAKDFRVWNLQLIRYAGYRQSNGTVIGDPANADFTEVCIKMGWKPKGGMFDVLPLVLSAGGRDPEMFEIPPDIALQVPLKHPKYPWFADLGYKWYAIPAVSAMLFDCGGIEFPAAPFNGWYMGTEVAARDLCDEMRYNMTELVAKKMGLDTGTTSSLWKDQAMLEVNIAVLHSYQAAGVSITDHHEASDSFIVHLENEQRLRGGCPGDWVWIVPPLAGSITKVFHQEMLLYNLKPSYEYQEDSWKSHVWEKDRKKGKSTEKKRRKYSFKESACAVLFATKMMGVALANRVKCIILYATETGKSEKFAKTTCEIFKHVFHAKVACMDDYDVTQLEKESLVLVISSTFGNGDPPENGEALAKALPDLANAGSTSNTKVKFQTDENSNIVSSGPLGNVRFAVFALGSRAYPNFCKFGHFVDDVMHDLGAERIVPIGEGDALSGQEDSFRNWIQDAFKSACDKFSIGSDINMTGVSDALSCADMNWTATTFRITPLNNEKELDVCTALSKLHGLSIRPCKLLERTQLQSNNAPRQTILTKLDNGGAVELLYQPGDHLGIYPTNPADQVTGILARLQNAPPPDQVFQVEILEEKATPTGSSKSWAQFEKMPRCSLRRALTQYLDVTTPPTQTLLKLLATQTSNKSEQQTLEKLATDSQFYEEWRNDKFPNMLEVLDEFPSLKVPPSLIMTQLPLLQQRYYSISSSPLTTPDQIHATIAVIRYRTKDGAGPVHEGVSSGWMNRCELGYTIPCTVRKALNFRMPEDVSLPILIVGTGTGIAPFRSFWQQRKIVKEMHSNPTNGKNKIGEMKLYFGCRKSTEDHIYDKELQQMKADGVLTDYYVAFSREPGAPKVYVQDLLKKNAGDVCNVLVKQGGHVYICGDVAMATDITTTLESILQNKADMSAESAKQYVQKLQDGNRLHKDIFGINLKKNSQDTEPLFDRSVGTAASTSTDAVPARNTDKYIASGEPDGAAGQRKNAASSTCVII